MNQSLMPFYLLYHAWDELEQIGENYYFEGADLDNIEEVIKEQAKEWIEVYVNGKGINEQPESKIEKTKPQIEKKREQSVWQIVKSIWKKK